MADQQEVHPLVAMLVDDPENPPDLTVVNGYIGPSTVDNCVRLYLSSAMNIWVDIPKAEIRGRSTIGPNPTNLLGEDIIWMLRADALRLVVQRAPVADVELEDPGGGVTGPQQLYPPRP